MTKVNGRQVPSPETGPQERGSRAELGADDLAALNDAIGRVSDGTLLESESELLRELVYALRTIRYGSIVLTVHDGKLVEINKSIRIRKGSPSQRD
jgi:hypothetical protein